MLYPSEVIGGYLDSRFRFSVVGRSNFCASGSWRSSAKIIVGQSIIKITRASNNLIVLFQFSFVFKSHKGVPLVSTGCDEIDGSCRSWSLGCVITEIKTITANEWNVDSPSSLSDSDIHAWIDGALVAAA